MLVDCLLVSVSACVHVQGACVCLRVSMCVSVSVHGLPTRVSGDFTVILCSPETSASRPCDSDGHGL